jgi:hypothetical protein
MRLHELHGTKRFHDRSFWEVLADFKKAGGEEMGSGRFANVVGHPSWPFVYKVFAHDPCYLDYVAWASTINHPCVPKFYGKPKQIVPFWSRPLDKSVMWVVKQERLREVSFDYSILMLLDAQSIVRMMDDPEIQANVAKYPVNTKVYSHLKALRKASTDSVRRKQIDDAIDSVLNKTNKHVQRAVEVREKWLEHPPLEQLVRFIAGEFAAAPIQCTEDLHAGNIMERPSDGAMVLIDPFWAGETPMQMHNRLMGAEIGPTWDETPPMLRGRQTKLPERPRYAPERPMTSDEIPF